MMGRSPCCDESGLKKGPWTPEEDHKLVDYIERHGHGSWRALPKLAGLNRCGKSCRLRWTNYLRPDIKRGKFSDEEEQTIINLHSVLGNKWSAIAGHLPGRTDNEIKNFWNTHLRKKLLQMGIDPVTHRPRTDLNLLANLPQLLAAANLSSSLMLNNSNSAGISTLEDTLRSLESDATQLAKFHILHNMLQVLSPSSSNPPTTQITSLLCNPTMPYQNQLNDNLTRMSGSQVETGLTGALSQFPALNPFASSSSFQTRPSIHQHQNTSSSCHDHHSKTNIKHGCQRNGTSNEHHNDKQKSGEILSPDSLMPALVPASPDRCNAHQIELMSNNSSALINQNVDALMSSNTSSAITAATPFEAAAANWTNDLIDDDATHSYWRDIIDQATSPSWPISS